MNRSRVQLPTTPTPKKYEVLLVDGTVFTGTKRQIFEANPAWWPHAREVQPTQSRRPPANDYSDVQTMIEQVEQDFPDERPGRLPTSARTINPAPGKKKRFEERPEVLQAPIQRRRSAETPAQETEDYPRTNTPRQKKRGYFHRPKHPMLYLGIGMISMLALWNGLSYGVAWFSTWQDDQHYGRPRTAQYDVVVGHNDDVNHPTHIVAMNLNRTIVIIELPGGDTSKARIYKSVTLFGAGSELAPVTLTFRDTTGDGRLDMIVHFQDSQIIYLNQKVNGVWQFVPAQSQ